ncbi:MAG TPA: hypothetical protein VN042_14780 [Asticcacaulis sp.]|nr:hypothetical protein [Asticcacaulis sp.]
MRHLASAAAIAAALFICGQAQAADGVFAGARVSTLGVGGEFGVDLNSHWTVRALVNGYDWDYNTTSDDIRYDGKLKLASWGGQIDYRFVADGPLYVTTGLYSNDNKIHATATPTSTTDIGGIPFTPEEIGTLTARGKFSDTAPYLGIGARWPIGPVRISLEAGAYFQGKSHVTLTSNGTYADNPTYQDALEQERKDLQNDMDDFKTYPVVALGVSYVF